MPNEFRKEANSGTRVAGGPEKKPGRKQSFMDRVRELAKMDGKPEIKKPPKPEVINKEGKKGSSMQEIQERANRIESE